MVTATDDINARLSAVEAVQRQMRAEHQAELRRIREERYAEKQREAEECFNRWERRHDWLFSIAVGVWSAVISLMVILNIIVFLMF